MITALLLIDLQTDYFNDPELERCRDDVLAKSNRLVRAARAAGSPVVEVQTVHAADRSTFFIGYFSLYNLLGICTRNSYKK